MKYIKKPIIIDAVRYMIDDSMPDWFMDRVSENIIYTHKDGTLDIHTLEGIMRANYGDYIILGVHGEVYPCNPYIFEETYDAVKNTESRKYEAPLNNTYGCKYCDDWNNGMRYITCMSCVNHSNYRHSKITWGVDTITKEG